MVAAVADRRLSANGLVAAGSCSWAQGSPGRSSVPRIYAAATGFLAPSRLTSVRPPTTPGSRREVVLLVD